MIPVYRTVLRLVSGGTLSTGIVEGDFPKRIVAVDANPATGETRSIAFRRTTILDDEGRTVYEEIHPNRKVH